MPRLGLGVGGVVTKNMKKKKPKEPSILLKLLGMGKAREAGEALTEAQKKKKKELDKILKDL